jgi:hypothetical protein
MPITPNQIAQGVAKGGNALGLESTDNGKSIVGKYLLPCKKDSPSWKFKWTATDHSSSHLDATQLQ